MSDLSDHSDVRAAAETLGAVAKETIAEKDAVIQQLMREIESLKDRLEEKRPPAVPYSDDELDAVRDRERDEEFARSEDFQDRGARD